MKRKGIFTILYSCFLFLICICCTPVITYGADKKSDTAAYQIELDASGGSVSGNTSTTITFPSDSAKTLDLSQYSADRAGYSFAGWYSGSRRINTVSIYDFSADRTTIKLTAAYTRSSLNGDGQTFVLDANGGSISGGDSVTCDFESSSGDHSEGLCGYLPSRDGYDFTGWNTKPDGSGQSIDAISSADYSDAESKGFEFSDNDGSANTRSLHIYAVWKEAKAPSGTITIGDHSWSSLDENPAFDIYSSKALSASITCDSSNATIRYFISSTAMDSSSLASQTFSDYTGAICLPTGGRYIIYVQLISSSGQTSYLSSSGVVADNKAPVISGITDGATYCISATATIKDSDGVKVYIGKEEVTPDENHQIVIPGAKGKQTITATDKAGNSTKITITVNKDHTAKTVRNKCETYTVCKYCKEQLSAPKVSHTALKKHAKVKATSDKAGHIEYWYCSDCGKYFSDKAGTNEIRKKDTVIEKLPTTTEAGKDNNSNKNNSRDQSNQPTAINEVSEMSTEATTQSTTASATESTTTATTAYTTTWQINTAFATTEASTLTFATTESTTDTDESTQTTTEKSSASSETSTRYQNPESDSTHSKVHNLTLVILLTVIITILVAFVIIIISGLKDGHRNDESNDDDDHYE